jgi:hypothetical protein
MENIKKGEYVRITPSLYKLYSPRDEMEKNPFTLGKNYEVLDVQERGSAQRVTIKDDKGKRRKIDTIWTDIGSCDYQKEVSNFQIEKEMGQMRKEKRSLYIAKDLRKRRKVQTITSGIFAGLWYGGFYLFMNKAVDLNTGQSLLATAFSTYPAFILHGFKNSILDAIYDEYDLRLTKKRKA